MGKGFKHGASGNPLDFKVVIGTTEPSNPKENTIWINTGTAISDYVFSAEQPAAASGRVWISTGTSSAVEFNALKKNGIQVYPISAKQYVSGAWVDKTALSYQNGEWVDWYIYLLNGADLCEYTTGGWTSKGIGWDSANNIPVAPTLTKNNSSITLFIGSGGSRSGIYYVNNKIDLTDVTKLRFKGYQYGGATDTGGGASLSIFKNIPTYVRTERVAGASFPTENEMSELNVEQLYGEYVIAFHLIATQSKPIYIDVEMLYKK